MYGLRAVEPGTLADQDAGCGSAAQEAHSKKVASDRSAAVWTFQELRTASILLHDAAMLRADSDASIRFARPSGLRLVLSH